MSETWWVENWPRQIAMWFEEICRENEIPPLSPEELAEFKGDVEDDESSIAS